MLQETLHRSKIICNVNNLKEESVRKLFHILDYAAAPTNMTMVKTKTMEKKETLKGTTVVNFLSHFLMTNYFALVRL